MKPTFLLLAATMLAAPAGMRGQDAAVDERLNKLSAQIQDLVDARDAQRKRIDDLARQVREMQDQQAKSGGSTASADDMKQLASKIQEVDDKRQQDNERILKEIEKLGKTLGAPPPSGKNPRPAASASPPPPDSTATPPAPDKGHFEYTIHDGDTLNAIAKAYSDQGIHITTDQILKANPGLKERSLHVGQKIVIPAQ
jgi:nucleoid-associated protein YgaU